MYRIFYYFLFSLIFSCTSNPEQLKLIPKPEENYITKPGDCWIEISSHNIQKNSFFNTTIKINSEVEKVAAYGFTIEYDSKIIELDETKGRHGIESGKDGYYAVFKFDKKNIIEIVGFDTYGKGPGKNLEFVILYWKAKKKGTSIITLAIDSLYDRNAETIGNPQGYGIQIQIE